jgi:uncharacterized NAD-dependent epimerase/dehydratase family protein
MTGGEEGGPMQESAIVLANGLFRDHHAKTTHALVRGPSRYRILAVVDPSCAGRDAGELLDGTPRGIPIHASVRAALAALPIRPENCVIGVATAGGVLPDALRADLVQAAAEGLTLVNGLHRLLAEDPELSRLVREKGGRILDIRRPRPTRELRFWSGEVLGLRTPRLAVLGTDCAIGKRTTCWWIRQACAEAGIRAEVLYTGQTGWLQGARWGFLLDATVNDFVCGELERAILDCAREAEPDLILIEGQSALRNPSGPCGSELILSAGAAGVILQHAPGRKQFVDAPALVRAIPPVREDVELIRLLGAEVWAVTLHGDGLDESRLERARSELARELALPVLLPLRDGGSELVGLLRRRGVG